MDKDGLLPSCRMEEGQFADADPNAAVTARQYHAHPSPQLTHNSPDEPLRSGPQCRIPLPAPLFIPHHPPIRRPAGPLVPRPRPDRGVCSDRHDLRKDDFVLLAGYVYSPRCAGECMTRRGKG